MAHLVESFYGSGLVCVWAPGLILLLLMGLRCAPRGQRSRIRLEFQEDSQERAISFSRYEETKERKRTKLGAEIVAVLSAREEG